MDKPKAATFVITRSNRIKWLNKPDGFPELSRRKLERMRRKTVYGKKLRGGLRVVKVRKTKSGVRLVDKLKLEG